MPLFVVSSSDGRSEIEEAETAEAALRQFKRLCKKVINERETQEDYEEFVNATFTVEPAGKDDQLWFNEFRNQTLMLGGEW